MNEKTNPDKNASTDVLLSSLQERAKELNCLYKVEELLNNPEPDFDFIFKGIIEALPSGWQFPKICSAKIIIYDKTYQSSNLKETNWKQQADINVQGVKIGTITVYYSEEKQIFDEGPFLKEERKLINTISDRIGIFIFHYKLKNIFSDNPDKQIDNETGAKKREWKIALDFLKETDQDLFKLIARKMMNYLCWSGVKEAEQLLQKSRKAQGKGWDELIEDENKPIERRNLVEVREEIFKIAEDNLSDEEILFKIQKWMQEDKTNFLLHILENQGTPLPEIGDAIRRYLNMNPKYSELMPAIEKGLNVALIRRFLSDQLEFISIAKEFIQMKDFHDLLQRIIYPPKSGGKLGGKSAGLMLASKILENSDEYKDLFKEIKIPKTWYITSDTIIEFLHYNNLEEVLEQKYKDLDLIRQEYPYIVQVFKSSEFPSHLLKDLSVALDDFGNVPLIVRSSSLLEDRAGAAFSGKYKSLFVANQGTKQQKLSALTDAIAEVYASVFNPDAIEYRAERGLLDYNEEMGILIQEVVGSRVGKYFFPAYAGVIFSNNEFRWSPRIKREDGLLRIVPGLGTRAVDRVPDDYPILIAPGKPGLRVNITTDEVIRYSPRKIDVINLENNTFETKELDDILDNYCDIYPSITDIVSVVDEDQIKKIIELDIESFKKNLVVTFDRLFTNTNFITRLQTIIKCLKGSLNTPVDIEFASDGMNFYLLQCRPQSYSEESMPSPIPKDIPLNKTIFSAKKHISNGKIPDITHIVYVDPDKYNEVSEFNELIEIGRAVGKLNKILPKRQFILMGPGRWGSRGDIKLGVNVTYSDINNTAVLIEIAKKKGNYLPDLSFGTHFFQDLVESQIRYIPLYPDDEDIIFNEKFLNKSHNILDELLPEYTHLSNILRVIDVPKSGNGLILRILMNADLDEAIAILSDRSKKTILDQDEVKLIEKQTEEAWRWRYRMAERIALQIDTDKFGVKAFYIFGSTKNATAGPASDIDILVHCVGDRKKIEDLKLWLNGWGMCLSELNYLRTGYKTENLLDIHIISDEDIKNKESFAMKIGAITDAAKELPLNKAD